MKSLLVISVSFFISCAAFGLNKEDARGTKVAALNCSGPYLTMTEIAKCIESGMIISTKFKGEWGINPEAKTQISKLTGCDSSAGAAAFKKCFSDFINANPGSMASADCWREIDEEAFRRCWGWSKKLSETAQPPKNSGVH
jgi:hypothetical protein